MGGFGNGISGLQWRWTSLMSSLRLLSTTKSVIIPRPFCQTFPLSQNHHHASSFLVSRMHSLGLLLRARALERNSNSLPRCRCRGMGEELSRDEVLRFKGFGFWGGGFKGCGGSRYEVFSERRYLFRLLGMMG